MRPCPGELLEKVSRMQFLTGDWLFRWFSEVGVSLKSYFLRDSNHQMREIDFISEKKYLKCKKI
ncbi:hypothetical protein DDT91_01075 [Algoriphagus sp. AK58]|nr:hypothetical protein [Algoriphagus sp. AK58]